MNQAETTRATKDIEKKVTKTTAGKRRVTKANAAAMAVRVRDAAIEAARERPYLVPVAAGAVGLGLGVLLSSKVTRFIMVTALGTVISETLGDEIRRFSGDLIEDLKSRYLMAEADETDDL